MTLQDFLIKLVAFIQSFLDSLSSTSVNKPITTTTRKQKPWKIYDLELIKESEGLRLKAYLPTANDVWTIGYGHTKTAKPGMVITEQQAEQLLRQDISWVENTINTSVTVPLKQNEYDALCSLVFNIGSGAFRNSTVLRKLNMADYDGAAEAFLMWNKQTNKLTGKKEVLKGLTVRREKEKSLFLS